MHKMAHSILPLLILFWVSCTFVLSSPCNGSYNRNTCMFDFYCDRRVESRYNWDYYRVQNLKNNVYYNSGEFEDGNCKLIEYQGYRIIPIHLILTNFDIADDDSIPVYEYFNYGGGILHITSEFDIIKNNHKFLYSIPNIKPMPNLRKLKISDFYSTVGKLSNKNELPMLEELDLSSNQITEMVINEEEYPFRNLKKNNLSDNKLERVPNFEVFRDLEVIDLSYNSIDVLEPITFDGLKDLLNLNLSHNRISNINLSLFRFTKLKVLNLNSNKIDHINANDFEKLTMLEFLDISSNLISNLDKDIFSDMNLLKELNVKDNEIVMIDKETFTNMPNLKFIDLSANKIKSIPNDLFRGKNLHNFSIEENSLEGSLTQGMFDGLTYVKNIDLSYQFLDIIEDYAFHGLNNLESLSLHHNNINNLTLKCFISLKYLKTLDISFNKIVDIMFDKQDLYSLEVFILKNNHLTTVNSNNFIGMTSLRYLDLSNNKINHIEPNSFESLHNLVNFEISNNPLDGVLNDGTFEGLNSLPRLDISSTLLTIIQNNSFSGMTRLQHLNVSHSKINTVQFNALSNTGFVFSIDLSFNELIEFSINTTDLAGLGEIYLNNNKIKFLHSSIFEDVPYLSTLIISFNKIEEISPAAFSETNNLEVIDLSYNENLNINTSLINNMNKIKFLSLSGIKKAISFDGIDIPVSELIISNSSIKDVKLLYLNNLKQLSNLVLSHNKITKLEYTAFANITTLRYLDISYNSISYIQPGTFKDNSLLTTLNMSHNSLNAIAYGTLRGLSNLYTIDVSYNYISSLKNERFYEANSLQVLIVDHNNIESFTSTDFDGTNLSELSLGNNPIPCETLVNFKQNPSNFQITAITLDEHNDENVDGIICNKKNDAYSRISKHYTNIKTNNLSNDSDSILINIRDILLDKFNTQTNKETDNEKYFSNLNEQFNKLAESNNEMIEKIMKNNEYSNTNLVNVTSQNFNAVETSIDKSNLLLEKIFRVLSIKTTTAPLTKDNATYENLLQYINKIKLDIDNDISFEKRNILDEVDHKIANLKTNNINASLLTNKIEHLEQKSTISDNSVFTEICVAFILIILICICLFLVYKSGIFVRKSFSLSTRELPSAMDSTL